MGAMRLFIAVYQSLRSLSLTPQTNKSTKVSLDQLYLVGSVLHRVENLSVESFEMPQLICILVKSNCRVKRWVLDMFQGSLITFGRFWFILREKWKIIIGLFSLITSTYLWIKCSKQMSLDGKPPKWYRNVD